MTPTDKRLGRLPRLMIATDNFLPRWDGIARFLTNLIPDLTRHFDVVVIAPDFGHVEQPSDYHLIKIPLRKGSYGDISFAKIRYSLIRKEVRKADLIFAQTIGPIGMPAILAAKRLGKPVVSYVHSLEADLVPMAIRGGPIRRLVYIAMRFYVRWIYNKPDLLVTPSEWVDDQLSWQGIKTRREVVHLGVDTKKFSPDSAKTLRAKLGVSDDDVLIGHVGRLAREKDIRTLLRGFIRLQQKFPNVKLLVVAKGLWSLQHLLSDREGVLFPGPQDNIVPYYRAMDIFVLSSLTETTCLSALEAMSCGKPIVSTPVGFVNDYVKDGKNGLFFPKKDSYKLTQQLTKLVRDPLLREKMGSAAREMVLKNFQWDKTSKELIRILKEMIK